MPKKILAVGVDIASDDVIQEDFSSRTSLLDWDIVLFRPVIDSYISYRDQYRGKPSLNDSVSFHLREACEHWRREIKQAVESGKTVFVFLPPLTEVYVDTGNREYSGTGRNRATTRIVDLFSNYYCLPVQLNPVNSNGSAVKLAPKGAEILAPYWSEFASYSEYHVFLHSTEYRPALLTRNGDRAVGTLIRTKTSRGALVCLPDIDFYRDGFLSDNEDDEGGPAWTEEASRFASRLTASLVALDSALRAEGEITPEPAWSTEPELSLQAETKLRSQLLEVEAELERIQRRKEEVVQALKDAGALRKLLFEKGKPLEQVIIHALKLMGFDARSFREGASEFDVVFESAEGRLIGEAEGKDNKAINVDKLRQLAMNIHEDLQREEVTVPAKGVLFGNGYRLTPPAERPVESFTEKCILAAQSSSTALVATRDLFHAVRYLADNEEDDAYAEACRKAILSGVGVTGLPAPPLDTSQKITDAEK